MDHIWHFVMEGQAQGPLSAAGVAALAMAGLLNEESPVWTAGWDNWQQLRDVPELMEALQRGLEKEQEKERGASLCILGHWLWERAGGKVCLEHERGCCQCCLASSRWLHTAVQARIFPPTHPLPAAAKRQRLGAPSAGPPPPEVQQEIAGWAEALDERSQLALFET